MSITRIFHLLTLIYLAKSECEFYMVGDTKWTFPTPGEVRKLWLTTAFDNVNISFKFDYNNDKNLYEHEQWFRNPLPNTWYELELKQNLKVSNAVVNVHNSQEIKSEHWELPQKGYENVLIDADEHVLLSLCDPRLSGLHTVIGNCAPSSNAHANNTGSTNTSSSEVNTHTAKVDKNATKPTWMKPHMFAHPSTVISTPPSASTEPFSTIPCEPSGSSSTNSVIFTAGLSPVFGLVIVLGLSIILNMILCYIAFRRRTNSQEAHDVQNQITENIYEDGEISPRHSAFYIRNVHQRGILNTYESHRTSSRHSTLCNQDIQNKCLENTYEPHRSSSGRSTLHSQYVQHKSLENSNESSRTSSRHSTLRNQENSKYSIPHVTVSNQKYAVDNEGFVPTNDMV